MSAGARRIERLQGDHETSRQGVIRRFHLTTEDVVRMDTVRTDDPLCKYEGSFVLQAEMIAGERAGDKEKPHNPPDVVLGMN